MKPRKPDRFDEIVKARMEKDGGIWSDNAAELLRDEHAWMRQIVRSRLQGETDPGCAIAYSRILRQLAQRRK